MSGIIEVNVALPDEPKPIQINGSAIQAATRNVQQQTNEQVSAVQNLGGKMSGGGDEIEVKNLPPAMPSAGGSDPKQVFADMQKLKADLGEQGKYDSLGNASPQTVGGKRTHRKHNARHLRKNTRKHRGSSRKSRSFRHSRSKLRNVRRKSSHKK